MRTGGNTGKLAAIFIAAPDMPKRQAAACPSIVHRAFCKGLSGASFIGHRSSDRRMHPNHTKSPQNRCYDLTVYIGEAEVPTLIFESQLFMINAK